MSAYSMLQILCSMKAPKPSGKLDGLKEENMSKNRFNHIVPGKKTFKYLPQMVTQSPVVIDNCFYCCDTKTFCLLILLLTRALRYTL